MKIIPPKDIDLISTNATESVAEWYSGTTYAKGDRARLDSTHKIYESLQSSNIGNSPDTEADWWSEVQTVNTRAMFDTYTSTQTTRAESLTVTVDASKCDHVALFNLGGVESVAWELFDTITGSPVSVSSGTLDLSRRDVAGWYDFFYTSFEFRRNVVQDIPVRHSSRLTVTLTGASGGTVACGHMSVGRAMVLGATKYGATGGFIDYSRDSTNQWGITTLEPGRIARRMELDLYVEPRNLDRITRIIESVCGLGAVWVGDNTDIMAEASETLLVYGRIKQPQSRFDSYGQRTLSLTIEGLT